MLALDQMLTLEYQGTTYTLKALHMLAAGAAGASLALERGLLTDATQVTFSAASGAPVLPISRTCYVSPEHCFATANVSKRLAAWR